MVNTDSWQRTGHSLDKDIEQSGEFEHPGKKLLRAATIFTCRFPMVALHNTGQTHLHCSPLG